MGHPSDALSRGTNNEGTAPMTGDQQRFFPLFLYGGFAILYTALVFRGELPRKYARILSQRNARPRSSILTIHAAFVAFLLYSVHVGVSVFPTLPGWLTDTIRDRGAPISTFEFLFVVAFVSIPFLERRWLYVERTSAAESEEELP
jgi:hypothetical protein